MELDNLVINQNEQFVEALSRSLHQCRSFRGRLKQYYVHGRLEECSKLEDCLGLVSRSKADTGAEVVEEKNRCLDLWTRFEGISVVNKVTF